MMTIATEDSNYFVKDKYYILGINSETGLVNVLYPSKYKYMSTIIGIKFNEEIVLSISIFITGLFL
jgi:hypothetical protein